MSKATTTTKSRAMLNMLNGAEKGGKTVVRHMARVVVLITALVGMAGHAAAALIAYEGFNYAAIGSDLSGNNGGFGFVGPWTPGGFNATTFNHLDIGAGSLVFDGLQTEGNRAASGPLSAIGGLSRALAQPLGAPGTSAYVSFLLRPQGTLNQGVFNGFFGLVLESPTEPELFIGKPGGGAISQYVLESRGGGPQVASGVSAVADETVLLVLSADFSTQHQLPGRCYRRSM
jgi:hypothetical protein